MDTSSEIAIACTSCAKAKSKCDRKLPCTRCTNKRIHCQARRARRSGDSSGNTSRQHDVTRTLLETSAENLQQWGYAPFGPVSLTQAPVPSPYSVAFTSATHRSQKLHQRKDPDDLPFSFDLSNGLVHSPSSTSLSLDTLFQPFGDMDGVLEEGGYSPTYEFMDGGSLSMIPTGTQTPVDFNGSLEHSLRSSSEFTGQTWGPSASAPVAELQSPSRRSSLRPKPSIQDPFSMESWPYRTSILEHPDLVAAREGWSYFKCNPTSARSACPKTANIYLEGLEQTLRSRDVWQQCDLLPATFKPDRCSIRIAPFTTFTRDKILAVTQNVLHKASKLNYTNPSDRQNGTHRDSTGFILLPHSKILEYFLEAYVCHFEPYYSSVPARLLNPNELTQMGNVSAATLLLLLMVALGASTTPTVEARFLTCGLTEACRTSFLDIIENDIEYGEDLNLLRCGLLFTTLAVWSGDKWQMDIGMAQRGAYIAMLDHRGLLDFRDTRLSMSECQSAPEIAWNSWKADEARSRLVASWVLADQEHSIFMDVAPILSISSLMTVMPDTDLLWRAKSSTEWLKAYERANGASYKPRMALCDLFRFFLDGGLGNPNVQLSPLQLRLLLHPVQSLTIHLCQFQRCLPDGNSNRKGSRAVNKSVMRTRFEEVQSMLKQWYALARRYPGHSADESAATCANWIIYHLISLNTVICLPEIELLASGDPGSESLRPSSWSLASCTENPEEVLFHCGQILRLLRSMPEGVQPPWWPAAVYRAALASWMTSMANAEARNLLSSLRIEANQPVALDSLAPDHPSLTRYLDSGEGQPMFTKRDGTMLSLEDPQNILTHCVEILNEARTTCFREGIQYKLARLMERWQSWESV